MSDTNLAIDFDDSTAWGAYRPRGIAAMLLSACHALPPSNRKYYKIGQILRGPLKSGKPRMYDVNFESLKMRLVNQGNYCERRALTMPQYYDLEERDWLCSKLANGGNFLDIGGNVGLFSLTVAGRLRDKVQVFTVEPDPQMYQRMLFNAGQNNLHINLAAVALSDYEGDGVLELSLQQRGENTLKTGGSDAEDVLKVPVTTLLHQCQQWGVNEITAMKIDVEGHEDKILSHFMAHADKNLWPRAIVIEHVHEADSIVNKLQSVYGYTVEGETKLNLLLSLDDSEG